MRRWRVGMFAGLAGLAVAAGGCGSSTDVTANSADSTETAAPQVSVLGRSQQNPPVSIPDYAAQLDGVVDAVDDASFPEIVPDEPTGVYGYSRYVWRRTPSGVSRLLVEGPRGQQVRCQDPALACSFEDLRELSRSGDQIPDALAMSADELARLVAELEALNAYVESFETIDEACAAGYSPETQQNPNMGIHMTNQALLADGFDPAVPEMLLWAKPGGEAIARPDLGDCADDGTWTGDDGYEVVGAAFLQAMQPEHPEGFSGPIDNWHIHYSACNGAVSDGMQGDEASCIEAGGTFFERTPVWMMHAYVADGFDSQLGVFAMYNDSIWPLGEDLSLANRRSGVASDGGVEAPIVDFDFGGEIDVEVGETITFTNSDGLPHTVTAGLPGDPSGGFDSGVLGSGAAWTNEFDQPGEFAFFCALHPAMTATVVVEG